MFSNKKSIVYIKRKSVEVSRFIPGKEVKIEKIEEYDLRSDNLEEIFQEVRKSVGKNVRILFSEELVYVFSLFSNSTKKTIEKDLLENITEIIPEKVENFIYEFKEIKSPNLNKNLYQIFAVSRDLLSSIHAAVEKAGLEIETIESTSTSLIESLQGENEPLLILITDNKPTAIILVDGGIYLTITLEKFLEIKNLIKYIEDEFGLKIKKAIIADKIKSDTKSLSKSLSISVEQKSIDPIVGLATKSLMRDKASALFHVDPKKEDKNYLENMTQSESHNMKFKSEELGKDEQKGIKESDLFSRKEDVSVPDVEDDEVSENKGEPPMIRKRFVYALTIVFILSLIAIGVMYFTQSKNDENDSDNQEDQSNDTTQTLDELDETATDNTEEEISEDVLEEESVNALYDLRIQFIKSSETSSVEFDLRDYLLDLGYKNVSIKNDPDLFSDRPKTVISIKPEYESYFDELLTDLKASDYVPDAEKDDLDESSDVDVIIKTIEIKNN